MANSLSGQSVAAIGCNMLKLVLLAACGGWMPAVRRCRPSSRLRGLYGSGVVCAGRETGFRVGQPTVEDGHRASQTKSHCKSNDFSLPF